MWGTKTGEGTVALQQEEFLALVVSLEGVRLKVAPELSWSFDLIASTAQLSVPPECGHGMLLRNDGMAAKAGQAYTKCAVNVRRNLPPGKGSNIIADVCLCLPRAIVCSCRLGISPNILEFFCVLCNVNCSLPPRNQPVRRRVKLAVFGRK